MIVIFQCYGGTHTSVVAAAIYTGRLNRMRLPAGTELENLPYFDRVAGHHVGNLHYFGHDKEQNPVFILGSRKWGGSVIKLLAATLETEKRTGAAVAVIDCLEHVTLPVRIGGVLSRCFHLTALGRLLLKFGIRLIYPGLVMQVELFENNRAAFRIGNGKESSHNNKI